MVSNALDKSRKDAIPKERCYPKLRLRLGFMSEYMGLRNPRSINSDIKARSATTDKPDYKLYLKLTIYYDFANLTISSNG